MERKPKKSEWTILEEQQRSKRERRRAARERRQRSKKHRLSVWHKLGIAACTAAALAGLYCTLVFSHIPVIEKWRTIYIETAMGTMTKQWLATMFLPQSIIDDVMNGRATIEYRQEEYNSDWESTAFTVEQDSITGTWEQLEDIFSDSYPEIDMQSLRRFLQSHTRREVLDADGYLMIDAADYDAEETGIETVYGDPVCAIDTRNGIVIVSLEGDSYCGRMAIVKNPNQVQLAVSDTLGSKGSYLSELCEDNDAVLGINASGFDDPSGTGNGGSAFGLICSGGHIYNPSLDGQMKVIGLDANGRLNITNDIPDGTRDAMQFSPALIVNGQQLISGSAGWGLQPRAVIGQLENGQMLLAVVDGRQPGYSIGITLGDLTDILYHYGAYQACNLDGGSSAAMYYNDRCITHSSAVTPDKGRHIPDAWVVTEMK